MPWAKFDDLFWSHPKTLRAGNEAVGAFVRMVCYCAQHLTDGAIDRETALTIAVHRKVIDRLVSVGLLELDGDGYKVHGYLERNPSRAQFEAEREAKTQRQNRWRENRARSSDASKKAGDTKHVDASTAPSTHASTEPSRDASKDAAPYPYPYPTRREENASRSHASAPTREEPKPSAPVEDLDPLPLLQAISDGATKNGNAKAWDSRAAARTVAAFVRELRRQERTPDELRVVGAYLASPEAKATHKAVAYSPDWFVSWADGEPDTRRVDWVLRSAREWQAARLKAKAERAAAKSAHEDRAWLDPFAAYRKGAQS